METFLPLYKHCVNLTLVNLIVDFVMIVVVDVVDLVLVVV